MTNLHWRLLQAVKAPGNLVVSAYVTCPDITLTVTPDLKLPGSGVLLHVDLAQGRRRLGGSALAQAYDQVGASTYHLAACCMRRPAQGCQVAFNDERKKQFVGSFAPGGLWALSAADTGVAGVEGSVCC